MGGAKKSQVAVVCPACGKRLPLVSVEAENGVVTKAYHCDNCGKEHKASEPL